MANPKNVAQSAGAKNVNTINRQTLAKVVGIIFHTDRFKVGARCRLYPCPDNGDGRKRLAELKAAPEPWCQPEQMQCCAEHKSPLGFYSSPIKQDPERSNRWVCFVEDAYIPKGEYILESPLQKGGCIYQRVNITGKMFAATPSGRKLDHTQGMSSTLLIDYMVGDGYSMEDALYNLCSYRYERSIGKLREEDMEKIKEGKEPESGFKTYLGVAHTTQEMVANAIGIVKVDFPFFKNLKKFNDFLNVDDGLFHNQRQKLADRVHPGIMFLWEKSGLQNAILKWTKDAEEPNIDGLLVNEQGKWKRLSGLGLIEEAYLEKYRQSLEENTNFRRFSEGVEMIGALCELLDSVIETAEMIGAFSEAWVAWERMGEKLGTISHEVLRQSEWDETELPWEHHGHGWFCRGDLSVLENLKLAADNSASSAQDAGWKWFLKMVPQALGFSECGELFKEVKSLGKAQKGYVAAKKFATTVDKLTHANVVDIYETQIANKWHDLNASVANDSALMHHAIAMSSQYWGRQSIALQFYVRAKVLYGLKHLIDLCGPLGNQQRRVSKYNFIQSWMTPGKTFEQAVSELKVEDYINELCLSRSFWVRKDHLLANWLQHWMQEKDPKHKNQVLRTQAPTESPDQWFKVEFQRYWPMHYRDHPTAEKFAARFSTDFSSVDDHDVQTCFLERGECHWVAVPGATDGSKMLEITRWVLLRDSDVIDSETPVRAVLVFKKDAAVRPGLPVTFQLERTDLLNVPGPLYQTVVRPLATPGIIEEDSGSLEKDEELTKYNDQLGAILSFSYSYVWKKHDGKEEPAKIYNGLKPMIDDPTWKSAVSTLGFKYIYQWARNASQWLLPSCMTFAVKYSVGDGHAEGYAHTKGLFWNSTVELTLQPYHSTGPTDHEFNERNYAKFTDLEFLRRQVPESPPPKPKYPHLDKVLVQYLDGEQWLPVSGNEGVAFRTPLRIIFVFKSKATKIPVVVRMKRTDGMNRNVAGPYYTSSVVSPLDPISAELRGKWGVVITPSFYVMRWRMTHDSYEMEVEILDDLGKDQMIRGIKPITSEKGCSDAQELSASSWSGYKFSVYYGIGTNSPDEANDVASIHGSLANDIPMYGLVGEQDTEDVFSLVGHGVFGVSRDDRVLYNGVNLSLSTMPFLAIVYDARTGQRERYVTGNHMHVFLDKVRRKGNLYDLATLGY